MARTPPNAADMVANYNAGINSTAQSKYKNSISRVQGNPMQAALDKVNDGTWLNAVTGSVDKLKNSLQNADPAFWKSQAMGAGATNWLASKNKGGPKYAKKSQQLAQASAAASQAAAAATGPEAKWKAAVNAMKAAFGRPAI